MAVQQILGKLGQWSIKLRKDAPPGVVAALEWFGHVAVIPGRMDPVEHGDYLLSKGIARHVGILRDVVQSAEGDSSQATLTGVGLAAWLGDEDGKGDVIETPGITLTGSTFAAAITALVPASVPVGTIYTGVAGTYSNTHIYQSRRTAIDYVCDIMGGEWRVNNDATLDAGPAASLYQITNPTALIVRSPDAGYDQQYKALPGALESTKSAKDYTNRVVLVAQALAGGTADAATVPYKDMHGNAVKMTRIVDETTDTVSANATARAQSTLNLFSGIRRALRLSATEFDIAGDFNVGDVVWCYDPDAGIADTDYEVEFRGRLIQPMPVRVRELSWPVEKGYTVAYRNGDGEWTDLTPWVEWESGQSEIVVSDSLSTALTPGVGGILTVVPGGGGGTGDTAVPDVPTFGTFTTTAYQPGDGLAQAAIQVAWTQPLNTDASTIVDGDHYEVRYRPTGLTDWQVTMVGFDQTSVTITALSPNTTYEFQIRAVDYASPINAGAWSATTSFLSATDTTPPATPAAPTVAASLIAVQVTHTLGLASGGTYNLPLDMDHLEVHIGASAGYTPDATTRVGKIPVNAGMVTGSIPAVGSFDVSSTAAIYVKVIAVDRTGNRSTASSAATTTAVLIDNAHITDLTVSKLTSGTMTAAVILGGSIKTATSGARVEMDTAGVRLYNSGGTTTVDLNTSTGTATLTGKVQTGTTGSRVVVDPSTTDVQFYPTSGSSVAKITGVGVDISGAGPASTLAWLDARSAPGAGGSYANLNLSAYASGTTRAQALLAVRQGDDQTSAWLNLQDSATEAFKGAIMGVANDSGTVVANVECFPGHVTLNHTSSGTYVDASATSATCYAAGSGNASIQNGAGSYFSANGASAYANGDTQVLLGSGSALLWLQSSGECRLASTGQMSLYGPDIRIGTPSGQNVRSDAIYNNAATFDANVGIATIPIGRLYNVTSSARFKVGITPVDKIGLDDVISLLPVTYYDRGQAEANGGATDGLSQQVGLIAEQVATHPTLGGLLVERDPDGDPRSVNYARVSVVLVAALQEVAVRLAALEGKPAPKLPTKTVPKAIRDLSKAKRKVWGDAES